MRNFARLNRFLLCSGSLIAGTFALGRRVDGRRPLPAQG